MPQRVLIVHSDPESALQARHLLAGQTRTIHSIRSPERIPAMMSANRYDVILLHESLTTRQGAEAASWVRHIRQRDDRTVTIILSEMKSYGDAVTALGAGAADVIPLPWPTDLASLVEHVVDRVRADRQRASRLAGRQFGAGEESGPRFIGVSDALASVLDQVERVARTDANVLILGENGTGKELVARALHKQSGRFDQPFVSVDMGALTETLFESELFGHRKGSFTDAVADREGKFQAADHGTLFLDEIGNLSLGLQAKLLTVLQQREVTPVGSNTTHPIDVHLICATNSPILDHVRHGSFRQDLLYRINTVEIHIPPLRARKEDIRPLADHFLEEFTCRYNPDITGLSLAAYRRLERHSWPGNIRELRHVIERAVIMSPPGVLGADDLMIQTQQTLSTDDQLPLESLNLEWVERNVIQRALSKHNGVVAQAALDLGLTRSTLYRRLEKYGL